jgi:hypothetical protein
MNDGDNPYMGTSWSLMAKDAAAVTPAGADVSQEEAAELREVTASIRSVLKQLHIRASGSVIVLPDAAGAFPMAMLTNVPPVVVDANTLRNDVLYSCTHDGRRTTLTNAASAGLLRPFCAAHVLNEVVEHHREWAEQEHVPVDDFVACWNQQYAPLLRVIEEVPTGLLTAEEQIRIDALHSEDPDDVPSATLALLIQGFYLTTDRRARAAVYGVDATSEELRGWLSVLQAGGDAGLLGAQFEFTMVVTELLGHAARSLFDRLTRELPTWLRLMIVAGLVAAGGYLARRSSAETRDRFARGLDQLMGLAVAAREVYDVAVEQLRAVTPAVPSWAALAASTGAERVLVRASLHALARSKMSHQSAVELAGQLSLLPVAQGPQRVREVLRGRGCFSEVYRGRWQVGRALVRQVGASPPGPD